jgi:hypothetical protein
MPPARMTKILARLTSASSDANMNSEKSLRNQIFA